jgi:hypothetical protein
MGARSTRRGLEAGRRMKDGGEGGREAAKGNAARIGGGAKDGGEGGHRWREAGGKSEHGEGWRGLKMGSWQEGQAAARGGSKKARRVERLVSREAEKRTW